MRYIIYTLGCKVNQYETQAMETLLREHGHKACREGESADAVIVNTCAVTAEAGRKSRQAINRLREENPNAVVAVSGCYSQLSPDTAQELGADIVYGTADRVKLVEAIEKAVATGEGERSLDKPFERRVFEELPAGAVSGHTRALLKIQDGCVNFCSYCIIPYTRGRVRSLPVETAAKQAAELEAAGYRELVITGIEIASYGVDLEGKPDLADVISAVAKAAPGLRLRLGSIEPSIITEDFCRRLAECGNVCRHFHLSLQSGCDATLKAMNRKYDTARFFESVAAFPTRTFSRIPAAPAPPPIKWTVSLTARPRQGAQSRRRQWRKERAGHILKVPSGRLCRCCLRQRKTACGRVTATPMFWCAQRAKSCAEQRNLLK